MHFFETFQHQITYVGMKPQEVTVKDNMTITLTADERLLDEVVVTAFGEQKRSAFTGSAAIVEAKTIETKQLTNVLSALQGEAAGVQMNSTSTSRLLTRSAARHTTTATLRR